MTSFVPWKLTERGTCLLACSYTDPTQHGGKSDQANLQESPSYACSTPSSCSGKARTLDRIINVTELALSFNGGKESGPEAPAKKAFD
jgi:hypothetical protein